MGTRIMRLVALFAVISVVGIVYVGVRYVGAGELIGLGPTIVSVDMRDSGGIFPDASVTYRGVEVGKVGDMRVTPGGLNIELRLDRTAPDIPANAIAVVANRSAVGEQYVDLQPTADGAPYLEDGSRIPAERTRTPVPVDTLLANLNSLATSVPLPELRTTVDSLYTTFDRTGPQLQRLMDAANPLVADAIRNLPQTSRLLADGRTVLTTQNQLAPQITSFSRDLAVFTDQLRRDDPNLRRLVNSAPPAAAQLEGLIRDIDPGLTRTLGNLLDTTRVLAPRLPGIEQVLVTYPGLSAVAPSVVPGDGRVHFGLVLNLSDPPYCMQGYLQPGAGWRPANDLSILPEDRSARCAEAPPVNVRGAQNAPAPSGAAGGGDPAAGGGTTAAQNQAAQAASTGQSQSSTASPSPTQALNSVPLSGILGGTGSAPSIVLPGLTP